VDHPMEGTLAIDLGNSNTVVAFQGEKENIPKLLKLGAISRKEGEVPSLIGSFAEDFADLIVGNEVLILEEHKKQQLILCSDFKRWIGSSEKIEQYSQTISPEKAGELLIKEIWKRLPKELIVKRLVLSAPVETYRAYRSWLYRVCESLTVNEIALVDEPTAAAMGAGLPAGSKILVVDIGGSTIDLSLVALEGGEGKAQPVAQLMRFDGEDLEKETKQVLKCAKVISKSGQRIGGRDFDKWIINYLCPNILASESLLDVAEKLKCRLSNIELRSKDLIEESILISENNELKTISLNRQLLEEILLKNGLLICLNQLFDKTIAFAALKGCYLKDLRGVVLVGGGARIPLIREWLSERSYPAPLLTPPPIEAVAKGALKLTPGVNVKDLLQRGVSLRCWEQKSKKHCWYPLFLAGQTWPTAAPLEIILSASREDQEEIELELGEPEAEGIQEVQYINGIPTLKNSKNEPRVIPWDDLPVEIKLNPKGKSGEDCLKLKFSIDSSCNLCVEGVDLRNGENITKAIIGSIR